MPFCLKKSLSKILSFKELLEKDNFEETAFKLWMQELILLSNDIRMDGLLLKVIDFIKLRTFENFEEVALLIKKNFKKKVFIVYGRNTNYFKIVGTYLKIFGFYCDVLHISNDPVGTQFIFPTLVKKISSSFKVIVIASADDIGKLNKRGEKFGLRPRLNVVLEAGLSYGILNADNVLLLGDEQISFKEISDLGGALKLLVKIENKGFEGTKQLRKKLEEFDKEWDSLFVKDGRDN